MAMYCVLVIYQYTVVIVTFVHYLISAHLHGVHYKYSFLTAVVCVEYSSPPPFRT